VQQKISYMERWGTYFRGEARLWAMKLELYTGKRI